ncbi:MAG: hypothetical protein R3353_07775 [Salegentibacter mishustinae]|nr:hypothetical protein [Salegentibacter mishustinae]
MKATDNQWLFVGMTGFEPATPRPPGSNFTFHLVVLAFICIDYQYFMILISVSKFFCFTFIW